MPEEVVVLIFTSIIAVTFLGTSAIRMFGRYLQSKHSGGPELDALRRDVDELMAVQSEGPEDLRARVLELEERVEFAERLLARGKDTD